MFNPGTIGMETIHDAAINYDYDTHKFVFDPDKARDYYNRQFKDIDSGSVLLREDQQGEGAGRFG